ncbi:unnamed protein product [Rhodiola kirilowii]
MQKIVGEEETFGSIISCQEPESTASPLDGPRRYRVQRPQTPSSSSNYSTGLGKAEDVCKFGQCRELGIKVAAIQLRLRRMFAISGNAEKWE